MNQLYVYNGDLITAGNTGLPALNRAFKVGDGLFETARLWKGQVLWEDIHLQRMARGMRLLGMKPWDEHERQRWAQGIRQLWGMYDFPVHARLRWQVFRAGGGAYAPLQDDTDWVLELIPLEAGYHSTPPARLVSYPEIRVRHSRLSACKTSSALLYVCAARYARDRGGDDALMFSPGGKAVEAASANLWWTEGEILCTPPLRTGCVDGVMRRMVHTLAAELGIPVKEKTISVADFAPASQVFLTNAIRGVWPVATIDKQILSPAATTIPDMLQKKLVDKAGQII
ncbi:MAG: aminotransferase class IV [Bacteroidia bacterium]|nr:aminotransferase class IV [Bacteroidia bacterium]